MTDWTRNGHKQNDRLDTYCMDTNKMTDRTLAGHKQNDRLDTYWTQTK